MRFHPSDHLLFAQTAHQSLDIEPEEKSSDSENESFLVRVFKLSAWGTAGWFLLID